MNDKNFYKQVWFGFIMAEKKIGEGLGIAGFTLGVLSIILAGYLGLLVSIVGFIFCMVQQKKHKTGLGKAGLILNIIGFAFSIFAITYLIPLMEKMLLGV